MADLVIENRVGRLEEVMADLAQIVARTEASVDRTTASVNRLSTEMREFKAESRLWREKSEADMKAYQAEQQAWREKNDANMEAYREDMEAYREEQKAMRREFNRERGEIANKLGTLAEDLVAPNLPRIIQEVTTCTDEVAMAVRVRRPHPEQRGRQQEYDVIVQCGQYALFNETKLRLKPEDINQFIEKLNEVRVYFPEYQDQKIIASLASLYVDPSLVQYGNRQGVLILATGDNLMDVQNEPGLKLREF